MEKITIGVALKTNLNLRFIPLEFTLSHLSLTQSSHKFPALTTPTLRVIE